MENDKTMKNEYTTGLLTGVFGSMAIVFCYMGMTQKIESQITLKDMINTGETVSVQSADSKHWGTGTILTRNGRRYLFTNKHVTGEPTFRPLVKFSNGENRFAGKKSETDWSLLPIDEETCCPSDGVVD